MSASKELPTIHNTQTSTQNNQSSNKHSNTNSEKSLRRLHTKKPRSKSCCINASTRTWKRDKHHQTKSPILVNQLLSLMPCTLHKLVKQRLIRMINVQQPLMNHLKEKINDRIHSNIRNQTHSKRHPRRITSSQRNRNTTLHFNNRHHAQQCSPNKRIHNTDLT